MKKKTNKIKRKGFTLIELLAVIVILAIIALIAVPIILNVISDSKKGAFKDSVYGVIGAAEYSYIEKLSAGEELGLPYIYEFEPENPYPNGIKYKGSPITSGRIIIGEGGEITVESISDGTLVAEKGHDESEVVIVEPDNPEEPGEIVKCPNLPTQTGTPNPPSLVSGMVPIRWNGTSWERADESNADNNWYDYNAGKWANIALVDSTVRSVAVGTSIDMSKIYAMYVWIPRYSYALFNVDGAVSEPEQVKVYFEDTATKNTGTNNCELLTHPSFTFGTQELSGIWFGKFETGAVPGSSCATNLQSTYCDVNNVNVYIRPGLAPHMGAKYVNNVTLIGRIKSQTLYGINTTIADSHIARNMDWGAAAYLSLSRFGKMGNSAYSGAEKEVFNNNYYVGPKYYLTGCYGGAVDAPRTETCLHNYDEDYYGTGGSTTGTIYGIYDMSGGSQEYVGVTTGTATKYLDKYTFAATYADSADFVPHSNIGDAIKEVNGWYGDTHRSLYTGNLYMMRGDRTGLFHSYYAGGGSYSNVSARAVLTTN